ncbi:MAG: hypothetical protein ABSE73_27375 [Planctomycetota bacterium]
MNDECGPVLAGVEPRAPHCRLILDPPGAVTIDVAEETLRTHFAGQHLDLAVLCEARRLEVLYWPIRMSHAEWAGISELLLTHAVSSAMLRTHPALMGLLRRSFDAVCALPYRMYAGLAGPQAPAIYLYHPLDFYPKDSGHYCLLSDRGWLCRTWVQLKRREVRMEEDNIPDHFLGTNP